MSICVRESQDPTIELQTTMLSNYTWLDPGFCEKRGAGVVNSSSEVALFPSPVFSHFHHDRQTCCHGSSSQGLNPKSGKNPPHPWLSAPSSFLLYLAELTLHSPAIPPTPCPLLPLCSGALGAGRAPEPLLPSSSRAAWGTGLSLDSDSTG